MNNRESFYKGFLSREDEKLETIDRTDSGEPVFKWSKCVLQPFNRIETCNKVENIRRDIDDLNMKIMKLLNVRSMMLAQVDYHIREICGSEYFLGYKWGTVRNEWYSKNFESDIIRNCVSNIRDIFFDKNDEKFKEFICDEVVLDDNSWDDSIGFTFSKKDFSNKFTLTIPNSTANCYLNGEGGEFSENLCVGEMRLVVKTGTWGSMTVFSSLSIIKVKAFIKNLIENYNAVIAEVEAKQMPHHKSERWYNNECATSPQITQDNISGVLKYICTNPEDVEVKEIEPKDHIPLDVLLKDCSYI